MALASKFMSPYLFASYAFHGIRTKLCVLQEFNLIVLDIIFSRSAFSIAESSEHSEIFQAPFSRNPLALGLLVGHPSILGHHFQFQIFLCFHQWTFRVLLNPFPSFSSPQSKQEVLPESRPYRKGCQMAKDFQPVFLTCPQTQNATSEMSFLDLPMHGGKENTTDLL